MILPTKYIKISNSLLSVGGVLLTNINRPQTVTSLWNLTKHLPEVKTFERFTLSLDLLYIIGLIDFRNGLLVRAEE